MYPLNSPSSMHETGHSKPGHWDNPEGWDVEGGGRGFRMGDTCTPMADSCQCMAKPLQYCKVISTHQTEPHLEVCQTVRRSPGDTVLS